MRALKLKWAAKLAQSRYFVILTDKESVIALDGVNPKSMSDAMALTAQASAVRDFHAKLGELIKEHDSAVSKLLGDKPKRVRKTTSNRKVKKIKVTEG